MVVPPTPEGVLTIQPSDLPTQRPDLRRLSAEMQQAAANAGLAEAATQPTFGLRSSGQNPMVRKLAPHRRLVECDFDRSYPV